MSNSQADPVPIFFILGRPRSGTTLLTLLFDAHPNVRIPPEFPVMLHLYQKFRHIRDWDEQTIYAFVDYIYRHNVFIHRNFENLRINRAGFTNDLLSLAHEGKIQDFLKMLNLASSSVFPKSDIHIVGDKNPVYSIYAERFMKIFPDARFICLVRDYRDNLVSMRKTGGMGLEAPILTLQVYRWRYLARLFLKCRDRNPEKFRIIRYEDLVTNTREVVTELSAFLGIPYDPAVTGYHRRRDEFLGAYTDPVVELFHGDLMSPVNDRKIGSWKNELTRKDIRMADFIAGKYAGVFNYETANSRFDFSSWLRSRPMVIYGYLVFRLLFWCSFLPAGLSLWLSLNSLVLVHTWNFFSGKGDPLKKATSPVHKK